TYLRFESGHRSLQGLIAGSFLVRPAGHRWGGELGGSVGASRYLDFASFWHATADARLHLLGADRGAWIGATAGRTAYGAGARPVTGAGVGAWAQRSQVMLSASATRSFVGDSAYSDFLATALTHRGAVTLDASLGARVASRGGGHGVFGEASATLALGERTLLFLAGGRYPTDPVSGSVAGRYVSGGVRLRLAPCTGSTGDSTGARGSFPPVCPARPTTSATTSGSWRCREPLTGPSGGRETPTGARTRYRAARPAPSRRTFPSRSAQRRTRSIPAPQRRRTCGATLHL